MRSIDIFLRALTTLTFLALLVRPSSKVTAILFPLCFFAVGLWGVMFPQGPIGWAKAAYKELDPEDPSLWWVARLVGAAQITFAVIWSMMAASRP